MATLECTGEGTEPAKKEGEEDGDTGEVSVTVCEQMDTARYVVRRMEAADIQQVRDLHAQLFPVRYGPSFFNKLLKNPEGNITSLVLVDTNPAEESKKMGEGTKSTTAVVAQKVVGIATCRVTTVEDSIIGFILGRQDAYLMTFGISSEYRRQGLATMLLERLKEVVAGSEPWPQTMSLHVQASNEAAFSFYKRAGFGVRSFETDYYSFSEKMQLLPGHSACRDAYTMTCSLKKDTWSIWSCVCLGDKIQGLLKKLL